jgi:hypothetical protein
VTAPVLDDTYSDDEFDEFFGDAYAMLSAQLADWGLTDLDDVVRDMLTDGDAAEVIPLKIRQTESYKNKFGRMLEYNRTHGMSLSEAEYLQTVDQLKATVRRYVGSGHFDGDDWVDKWVQGDVSPTELNDRLQEVQEDYLNQDPSVKNWWAAHGLAPQQAMATMLDPSLTETDLKKKLGAGTIGGAAWRAFKGQYDLSEDRASSFSTAGVSGTDAFKAYQGIASREHYDQMLARGQGTQFTRQDEENEQLLGDQDAAKKRRRMYDTDEGQFKQNYLGGQRALGRDVAGSY